MAGVAAVGGGGNHRCRGKCQAGSVPVTAQWGWGAKPLSTVTGNKSLQEISGSGPYSEAVRNYQKIENKKITQS